MTNNVTNKRMVTNSGLYIITNFLKKGINLILLPLYTYFLTPNEYGIISVVMAFSIFVSSLFSLGLYDSIMRFKYQHNDDEKMVKSYWSSIVIAIIFFEIFFTALLLLFRDSLFHIFLPNIEFAPYIFLGTMYILFQPIYFIFQGILVSNHEGKMYAINHILRFFTTVILTILFLVILKWGATGVLLANSLTVILFAIYSIYYLFKNKIITIYFNFKIVFTSLKYSIPLIPYQSSQQLSEFASKGLLNISTDLSNVGLFSVGSQFGNVIDSFQSSIHQSYKPWLYNKLKLKKENENEVVKMTFLLMKVGAFLSLGIATFGQELIYIMAAKEYRNAWTIMPIIAVAYLFKNLYYYYLVPCMYNFKAARMIFINSVLSNFIQIAFIFFTVSYLGLYSPSIGLAIGLLYLVISTYFLMIKYQKIDLNFRKQILLTFITIVFIGLAIIPSFLVDKISVIIITYKLILMIIYATLLFYNDRSVIIKYLILLKEKYQRRNKNEKD